MMVFQEAMDGLEQRLTVAEREKVAWQGVGDILIKELQPEVDVTKVQFQFLILYFSFPHFPQP